MFGGIDSISKQLISFDIEEDIGNVIDIGHWINLDAA